jgi:ribonucleotide reductase alpha subunit
LVNFDQNKIVQAISKAMESVNEGTIEDAQFVARSTVSALQRAGMAVGARELTLTVEGIQDAVERELMLHGFTNVAKHYILYREERAKKRAQEAEVPDHVRGLVERSRQYFSNQLAEFVYYRTYSRWIEAEGRRETWIETVDRYMSFMNKKIGDRLTEEEYNEIRKAILNMEVMPSMRLMWSAGVAAEKTNVAAFNCAYIAPCVIQDFAEILYILACGTGVGFSAESRNVQQLPVVAFQGGYDGTNKYLIEDSKEGWADSLTKGMQAWYEGHDVDFDYSQLRPEGARLKTMGGRSSGPKPLMELH